MTGWINPKRFLNDWGGPRFSPYAVHDCCDDLVVARGNGKCFKKQQVPKDVEKVPTFLWVDGDDGSYHTPKKRPTTIIMSPAVSPDTGSPVSRPTSARSVDSTEWSIPLLSDEESLCNTAPQAPLMPLQPADCVASMLTHSLAALVGNRQPVPTEGTEGSLESGTGDSRVDAMEIFRTGDSRADSSSDSLSWEIPAVGCLF